MPSSIDHANFPDHAKFPSHDKFYRPCQVSILFLAPISTKPHNFKPNYLQTCRIAREPKMLLYYSLNRRCKKDQEKLIFVGDILIEYGVVKPLDGHFPHYTQ